MSPDEKRELQKIEDTLDRAVIFHQKRDEMNAETHLATTVRYSPLTVALETAQMTLKAITDPPPNF